MTDMVQWQAALDHANTVRFAVATEKATIRRLPRREAFHRAADLLEANEDPVNAIRVDWLLLSIPKIGATDFGYRIARQFELRMVEPRPALVPLTFDPQAWAPFVEMAGIALEVDVETGSFKGRNPTGGRFREDLLFRINTLTLEIPPLRERREDIPQLAEHFVARFARTMGKNVTAISGDALELLKGYGWPGNIRELAHAVERAVLMAQTEQIQSRDLGLRTTKDAVARIEDMSLEDVEGFLIKKTLARCDGNARKAAEELGLSRSAFYRRLERYGL